MPPSVSRRTLLGAGPALLLAGCSLPKLSPKADAFAQAAYAHLIKGEDAALEAMMAPALRKPDDAAKFAKLRSLLPTGTWRSVKTVGWRVYAGTGGASTTLQHAYDYGDRTVFVSSVLVPKGDSYLLTTFDVNLSITGGGAGGEAPSGDAPPTEPRPAQEPRVPGKQI